jgi:Tfp pilus assembly protein FimT
MNIDDIIAKTKTLNRERGSTLLQVLITVALIAVVSTFAVIGVGRARDNIRLQNSVSVLTGYLEKARIDAVRRHDSSGTVGVTFTNPTTYNVTMDFGGSGTVTTRSFSLESGVQVIDLTLPSARFNWRGRTSSCTITFALQNAGGEQSWVDVSDAGDTTINADVDVLPTVSYANVNSNSDVTSSTVVSGSGVHNNTADCPNGGTGAPGPPITGTGTGSCTGKTITANPSSLSIKKNGGGTGTVVITLGGMSGANTVTSSTVTNLQVSPASQSISGSSPANFSITSLNNTRGTFGVTFTSTCSSVTVAVKVTN